VFLVELVHEHDREADSVELRETAGDPFVPPGDEDNARVFAQGALKLFGEIVAAQNGARFGHRRAAAVAAAACAGFAHRTQPVAHRILCDADRHLFLLAARVLEDMLRVDLEPTPHVGAGRPVEIVRLRLPEREEATEPTRPFVGRLVPDELRVGEDEGLAFHANQSSGWMPGS